MKRNHLLTLTVSLLLILGLSVGGVFAVWIYPGAPADIEEQVATNLSTFRYGTIYITQVQVSGGSYASAQSVKVSDLDISSQITLNAAAGSTVVVDVTFYNNTDVNYYYNEAQTVSHNNSSIKYSVSGIEQKDAVAPKTFKTVSVTFSFSGSSTAQRELLSQIHFNFVVDKDSITDVVAQTALDRFRDILNNVAAEDSYDTLDNAMNNRGSFMNKASAVTYIGNVSGSSSADSQVVQSLFGNEFMSMDLDGDGKAEPITIMIKRENLDEDSSTGASYTYSSLGRDTTVDGVEMTLYITAENLSNLSSNKKVTVYAAAFTKAAGSDEWVQITSLAKGTATANNYNGYGSANSFNTDTWVSQDGQTIGALVAQGMQ
jgi:hypothetical protein